MSTTTTAAALTWRASDATSAELLGPHGQQLARFEWGPRANHPYVTDLRSLGHRGVLTTHAPHDHRWHHGLWFSWKFVDDVLFWEDHPGYGGNRGQLGRSAVTAHDVTGGADGPAVRQELEWRSDAGDLLLTEVRHLTATTDTGVEGTWALDWDQTWTAIAAVRLSTTPWPETPWGGYAGLSYRPARAMATGEVLMGPDGRSGVSDLHGQRLAWAAYSGAVDGAETDEPDAPAHGGVALLPHPGDHGAPHPVYAASAADGFGFLATAPLMHADRRLDRGEELRARARVLVLPGAARGGDLDTAHRAYAGRPARSQPTA
ncbi:DUF6807 family protein [Kineococcus terrestris]|uniref:DUF6807 family protein n=1 Tax=Kineococcus terrestris TaxID=2044856 RepID=UPI0034DB2182